MLRSKMILWSFHFQTWGDISAYAIATSQLWCTRSVSYRSLPLWLSSLPTNFIKKDGAGAALIQRIYIPGHRNRDGIIAKVHNGWRNTISFAPEDNTAIPGKIRLRQNPAFD